MSKELIERLRGFETDHDPDGWPAIRMKDISALCGMAEQLEAENAALVAECDGYANDIAYRYVEIEQLKEAQAEIEQLKRSRETCTLVPTNSLKSMQYQLAASQANEVKLREALLFAVNEADDVPHSGYCECRLCLMLELPSDTTALEAMIQKAGEVMRERCANGCEKEAVQIVVDGREEQAYNNAVSDCASAIRALPGVTVEDLQNKSEDLK